MHRCRQRCAAWAVSEAGQTAVGGARIVAASVAVGTICAVGVAVASTARAVLVKSDSMRT